MLKSTKKLTNSWISEGFNISLLYGEKNAKYNIEIIDILFSLFVLLMVEDHYHFLTRIFTY